MKTRVREVRSYSFVLLLLLALSGSLLAQPNVTSLTFNPVSINTTGVSASVTINFNITGTGVYYFATAFQDPSGNFIGHQIDKTFTPSNSVTDSVTITFPPFSPPGTYNVAYVFALDANGFEFLNGLAAVSAAFPNLGTLTVSSAVDTTPPNLTSLTFNGSINTTSSSDVVNLNFSATDAGDNGGPASGVASVSVSFLSPSGGTLRTGVATVTPAASATGTLAITFPKLSEAGTWTLSNVIVSDQADNTQVLATADLAAKGISTTLTVTSATDTTAPTLTAFSITPGTISSNGSPVSVGFSVTDDLSGANNVGVTLVSPSGNQQQSGSASFAPALTKSGSIVINFPTGTEQGLWSVAFVFLSDAQGNTRLYNASQLAGLGFSSTLNVIPPGADTTPPVIFVNVSPLPNSAGWNNTLPVTVTFTATDPESGITASSASCTTPTQFTSPTTGTTVTCTATNGAGLSSSLSVVVKIDIAPPVVTNQLATPNPVIVNTDVTVTATVTDTGGSNVKSAEFSVDGGPFDDLAPVAGQSFGTASVNVTLTLPASATPLLQTTGVHSICFHGTDFADNVSANQCVLFAVYDPNGGFATGGGNTNSPAGADLANPSGSGQASFAFNPKYLPNNPNVPSGDFQYTYNAGNINFKSTGYDFLVITNGNRAQAQGTGTLKDGTVCKFSIDAWNSSFQPGNVDALGVTIFNCGNTTGNRYALPTAPIRNGSIKIHQ